MLEKMIFLILTLTMKNDKSRYLVNEIHNLIGQPDRSQDFLKV